MAVLYLKGDVSRDGLIVKRGQILRNRWGNMCFRFDIEKSLSDYITAAAITFTRATTATYFDSAGVLRTAASGAARFDHDPATLTPLGLLVEEQRTNIAFNSAPPTNWTTNLASFTGTAATGPDGSSVTPVTNDGTDGAHFVRTSGGIQTTTQYTMSFFAKKGSCGFVHSMVTTVNAYAQWNLDTGELVNSGAGGGSGLTVHATKSLPGGWMRFAWTITTNSAGFMRMYFLEASQNTASPSETSSGTGYVWGVQIEVGAFPTSLIPTSGASATRNADVATMTGANFSSWFNASEGTFVVEARPLTATGTRPLARADDGTANEIISVRGNVADPELYIVDGGVTQAQIDAGTITALTSYKIAAAYKANDCAASKDGAAVVTDTSATLPTVTQLRIGSDGTNYANGHIRRISYWPKRLSNDKLKSLSAGQFK